VQRISFDHKVRANLDNTVQAIGADQVWLNQGEVGFTGRGITVAVIDSGVTRNGDLTSSVIQGQVSFGPKTTVDEYGHGTHVAGIITADGLLSSVNRGYGSTYRGVAPEASVINLRVLDANGAGRTSNVMTALDWCLKNKDLYNIRVINLSLGHPIYESYKTDPLCQMVERCVAAGIVVVTAAGNYGKDDNGNPVYGGITSPGNDPAAITVGAINTHNTPMRSDDTLASYSSRGPTAIDGLIKPDLVAPGNKIVSSPAIPQRFIETTGQPADVV
jgi:serine protease AprX